MSQPDGPLTGRCYCGRVSVRASVSPETVVYCHCGDCRRWTGSPVAAFVALKRQSLELSPEPAPKSSSAGVERWTCPDCGSPLAATFDYLPGMIWVPVGILDAPDRFPPVQHSHDAERIAWLHLTDDLPRDPGSGRERING